MTSPPPPRHRFPLSWLLAINRHPFIVAALFLLIPISYLLHGMYIENREADITKALTDIATLKEVLSQFHTDNARYPTTTESLQALATPPPNTPHWQKLLDQVPLDPWNDPYHYTSPGLRHPTSFDLSSNGPDTLPNTSDDITN